MRAVQVGNTYVTQRYVEDMMLVPAPHLQNDGKANMPSTSTGEIDKNRVGQLNRLTPAWK
jgi:ketosteroid isomerase-like protein